VIIYIPEEKLHFIVIDCWDCNNSNGKYCIEYYNHTLERIQVVYSSEVKIVDDSLDNYKIEFGSDNMVIKWKFIDNFDYYQMLEYNNFEEYDKFHKWFTKTNDYLKIIDLNRSLLSKNIEAIPIEKSWVQCPECSYAFKEEANIKYLECPKCKTILINPYFKE